ncbi:MULTISPECIES: hypothetical protein [Brachybacterium]|uniref:hypothetical protein n=1 Tax=Brachybacterium TaxID=43668 RepID=UPI003F92B532
MDSIEISDRDGDALTITTGADGVWITCTQGPHEVTVGPLPTDDLSAAFARASAAAHTVHPGPSQVGQLHTSRTRADETHAGPAYNRG